MGIIELIKTGKFNELDLLEYVTSNDVDIAIAVAESEKATVPILDIAAHDKDKRVRLAAAQNPNTSKSTLELLLHDSDKDISDMATFRLERSKHELVL